MISKNILQAAYSDIGTVIPVLLKKENNRKDYVNKMTVLLDDLKKRFKLDIESPSDLANECYDECISYDEVNTRGIVEGIYLEIGSGMIVIDNILDKKNKTCIPNTSIYNVYALNLTVRDFSEYGTAYITKAPNGRRKHVQELWEQADDNINPIDFKQTFSFGQAPVIAIEMDKALNNLFDDFANDLLEAYPGTETRNYLHREFFYMSCICFVFSVRSRPEAKTYNSEAEQFILDTLCAYEQFFSLLPEYYGNFKEMCSRLSLYLDKGNSVEVIASTFRTLLKDSVIRDNGIMDSELLTLTMDTMNTINEILDRQ